MEKNKKTIWIDLDNSPHVPFFRPILEGLEKNGFSILLTVRDCFQVIAIADLFKLKYKSIGRHYGKNKLLKIIGIILRALKLLPTVLKFKPAIALSHGSRSQLLLSNLININSILILDYEFAQFPFLLRPKWVIAPHHIPKTSIQLESKNILNYTGIKEDVYVPFFKPDPRIIKDLGIEKDKIIITLRPPATEAHYHNPESEIILEEVFNYLGGRKDVCIILLPRNDKQGQFLKSQWGNLFEEGRIKIPEKVVDGLNLIWYSDFVISGGGTMNREAAALDVPVYSIFRGKMGAIDKYLSEQKRLILVEKPEDVRTKIKIEKRNIPDKLKVSESVPLKQIIDIALSFTKE